MKRFGDGQNGTASSAKRAKTADASSGGGGGGGGKMSFAAKMMAKMGYKEGEGLGTDGSGILTPIEVRLRPQGAGVGVVKEKTAQAKAEAKRNAERRGEKYEDSSEEEKELRRKLKETRKSKGGSVPGAKSGTSRPKQKIRTAAEIEAEEGMQVPNVFKSLIDMTGSQPRTVTSTAGLFASQSVSLDPEQAESRKLANVARRELEAFADAWRDLEERKKYIEAQQQHLLEEIVAGEEEAEQFKAIHTELQALQIGQQNQEHESEDASLEHTVSMLEKLQGNHAEDAEVYGLDEVAVAALLPVLRGILSHWDPMSRPKAMTRQLSRISSLLRTPASNPSHDDDEELEDEDILGYRRQKHMTPFEALLFQLWLPPVRTAVINSWDPYDPRPMISLIGAWKRLLPGFIFDIVVNQVMVQRLSTCIEGWRVGSNRKGEPHLWLLPWLQYLDAYHLDPKSSDGLLSKVKQKFRRALTTWRPEDGLIPGLAQWQDVRGFRDELNRDLELRLLPSLAKHLRERFEMAPADQQLQPLDDVVKWLPHFQADKFARIFTDSFFPLFVNSLYDWLVSKDAIYDEVEQWFLWWQSVFPQTLRNTKIFQDTFAQCSGLIQKAQSLGPEKARLKLRRPDIKTQVEDQRPQEKRPSAPPPTTITTEPMGKPAATKDEPTFRELVEDACEREELLLMPLRKAHEGTGMPLFRITASASGTGGAVAYMKGDLLYVQNKRNKSSWEVVDIFEEGVLSSIVEGK